MKVFVMAAGRGERLKSIWTGPKIMFSINGKPLIQRQYEYLKSFSRITDIIFVLSWEASTVVNYIKENRLKCGWRILELTDTGTELTQAAYEVSDPQENFIVLNGDTLLDVDINKLIVVHQHQELPASMVVKEVVDISDKGWVIINKNDRVINFREKTGIVKPGLINAGMYLFNGQDLFSRKFSSIERNFIPRLVMDQKLNAFIHKGYCFDCGTPLNVQKAERFLRIIESSAKTSVVTPSC